MSLKGDRGNLTEDSIKLVLGLWAWDFPLAKDYKKNRTLLAKEDLKDKLTMAAEDSLQAGVAIERIWAWY